MPGPGSPPSAGSFDRPSEVAALDELGAYEVVSQLDRGPVTTSYQCRKSGKAASDGLYVLSVVQDELRTHRWLIDQLLAETAKCSVIRHPNVEAIVDFGTIRERTFVVTRYIDGCSLAQLLSRPVEMPYRIALPLLVDVLRGLHAAHTHRDSAGNRDSIVHSGVSPASILVGRDGVARITEFGIARVQMRTTQTMPGIRHDRFAHLAPEQIGEVHELEASADVFAVGTVLWSILTGLPLFQGSDPVDTMHRVLHVSVPLPSSVGRQPPAWLDEICMLALNKDPHLRYPSAEHMAAALQTMASQKKTWALRPEIAAWVQAAIDRPASPDTARSPVEPRRTVEAIRAARGSGSMPLPLEETRDDLVNPRQGAARDVSRRSTRSAIVLVALGVGVALLAAVGLALRSGAKGTDDPPLQTLHGPNVASSLIPPTASVEPPREPQPETQAVAPSRPTEPSPPPSPPPAAPGRRPPDPRRAPTATGQSEVAATKVAHAATASPGAAPTPPADAVPAAPSMPGVERNPYMRH